MSTDRIKLIGSYCKNYRIKTLDMSLTEFCKATNSNIKNVNAFESGRANSIDYLFNYWKVSSEDDRIPFLKHLFQSVREV